MCRSIEHALMVRVEFHPDSRSFGMWSTSYRESGQGELHGDVLRFSDDADGRARLHEVTAEDVASWLTDTISRIAGAAEHT